MSEIFINPDTMQIRFGRNPSLIGYELHIYAQTHDNKTVRAKIDWEEIENLGEWQQPLLRVDARSHNAFLSLMNQMWESGFRPDDIGSAGHLQATQDHLKDMKSILFRLLDKELGENE